MVWVLAAAYLRRADKVFDPLAAKAAERAFKADAGARAAAAPPPATGEGSTTSGNGEVPR